MPILQEQQSAMAVADKFGGAVDRGLWEYSEWPWRSRILSWRGWVYECDVAPSPGTSRKFGSVAAGVGAAT